jgi:hypothetical protein
LDAERFGECIGGVGIELAVGVVEPPCPFVFADGERIAERGQIGRAGFADGGAEGLVLVAFGHLRAVGIGDE